ncbi:MAG: hypothetical protein H7336_08865, partial [Bacteriovorax sp.]|nr:hypothetical protein [Bacteriovorax sp.]
MKRFYNKHNPGIKGKVLTGLFSWALLMNFETPAFAAGSADCAGMNHPAYQDEYRACLRVDIAASASAAGVDCIDCLFAAKEKESNPWIEALGIVAQPLAYVGATYLGAKYANKSQEAWANSYAEGFKQCTNRFNSYLDYSVSSGANPILPADASTLQASCNGNGMGSYAGYGGLASNGVGGYGNPFQSAGYSSGMLGGMMGPNYGAGGYGAGVNGGYGTGLGYGLGSGLSGMMGYGYPGLGGGLSGGINIGIGGGLGGLGGGLGGYGYPGMGGGIGGQIGIGGGIGGYPGMGGIGGGMGGYPGMGGGIGGYPGMGGIGGGIGFPGIGGQIGIGGGAGGYPGMGGIGVGGYPGMGGGIGMGGY